MAFSDYLSTASGSPLEAQATVAPEETGAGAFILPETATGEQLAAALRSEHAQTIAVVLANVAPATAAAALALLSPVQQFDVARRIADLDQVDDDALRTVQQSVSELIASASTDSTKGRTGVDALQRIWQAASVTVKSSLQHNLGDLNARFLLDNVTDDADVSSVSAATAARPTDVHASGLGSPTVANSAPSFESLSRLDRASLERVFKQAEGRLLLLALAGASPEFIDRVYRHLPRREAQLLRRQIEQQGPIALRDVREAQHRVAALANQLAAVGEIEVPDPRRFTTAA
jgi:flagellar motor switch protein FliG